MIKHLDGVCHVYIDDSADPEMAVDIADNAKTQRYGTCNTMETLLVAQASRRKVLPAIGQIYERKGVEMRADRRVPASSFRVQRRRPSRTTTPSGSRRSSRSAW